MPRGKNNGIFVQEYQEILREAVGFNYNIFDLIINSEYYNYIQGVGVTFGNGGLETDMNPKNIYCEVVESPKANAKTIWVNNENSSIGMRKNIKIPTQEGGCNPKLLKVLAKKRNSIGNDNNFQKEVPQIKNVKGLDKYMPTNCNNLIGDISGDGGTFTDMHVTDVACNIKNGYIGDWNVAKSADWLLKQTTTKRLIVLSARKSNPIYSTVSTHTVNQTISAVRNF